MREKLNMPFFFPPRNSSEYKIRPAARTGGLTSAAAASAACSAAAAHLARSAPSPAVCWAWAARRASACWSRSPATCRGAGGLQSCGDRWGVQHRYGPILLVGCGRWPSGAVSNTEMLASAQRWPSCFRSKWDKGRQVVLCDNEAALCDNEAIGE